MESVAMWTLPRCGGDIKQNPEGGLRQGGMVSFYRPQK